jgi:hypothetical protein
MEGVEQMEMYLYSTIVHIYTTTCACDKIRKMVAGRRLPADNVHPAGNPLPAGWAEP